MKKNIIISLLMFVGLTIQAQTDLTGRVYHNANILSDTMKELTQDADSKINEAKTNAIKKAEEKKKRKLTDTEKAKMEQEVEKAQKTLKAMRDGMSTAVTITFKDEANVVVKVDTRIDDEVLKAAEVGWAKRKLIQAALKLMPSQKGKYSVSGNMVIVDDGEELDTMLLSDDGKYLSGKLDEKKPFKLSRIK
ncbi:MAG: hypothetical protein J6W52_11710 [Bacteroidaceae bacterium]|nr:hypothetical protein [Bacteroidaceae bacterium]